jgi:hypothetical protein
MDAKDERIAELERLLSALLSWVEPRHAAAYAAGRFDDFTAAERATIGTARKLLDKPFRRVSGENT